MKKIRIPVILAFVLIVILPNEAQIKFKDVTKKAGLLEPLKGMATHNSAWGDVNNDGYPDLLVGNFTHFHDSVYHERGYNGPLQPNKLFLNQGGKKFVEVMDSPVRIYGKNSGGAFADFDNDGDLDLVLPHQAHLRVWPGDLPRSALERNYFYENDGEGNFIDRTKESGLDFSWPFLGRSSFVFDFDGDGLLDIFMQEDAVLGDISGGNSRLMKNLGGLAFKDVTAEAGFPTGFRNGLYGLGGFVDDVNGDSWPDVFFAHSCRMFINNADGTFREPDFAFVPDSITRPAPDNMDWTCGANTGDIDGDGDMDFVMGDHLAAGREKHRIFLYLNEGNDAEGNPVFRDITEESGIPYTDGRAIHIQMEDIDNDGLVDILTSKYSAIVYRNLGVRDGKPRFGKPVDSGHTMGIGYWAGGCFGDYDRDGRIDFFGPEWDPRAHSPLLKNVTRNADNYIDVVVDLEDGPNRNGIGALVEIFKAGMLGKPEGLLHGKILSLANGYSSGQEAIAHIGLPSDEMVDIRVSMPCEGPVYEALGVKRNQRITIRK